VRRIPYLIFLFMLIPLYMLLTSCTNGQDTSMAEIVKIWESMYGKEYVVKMPESGIYCSLWPSQLSADRAPTFSLSVLHSDSDAWLFENLAPIGDDTYICYTTKTNYAVGEDITVCFENNSEFDLEIGSGNDIDLCISVNDKWYILNRNVSRTPTSYACTPGTNRTWTIDEYFFNLFPHYYDRETNTYAISEECSAFDLPKGHYKVIVRFSSNNLAEFHGAQCEFDIS